LGFEIVALVCAALFAGASAYVTFVEHPARVSCGTSVALAELRPSYRRGPVMQASLAALGLVAAVLAWLASRDVRILIAGLLLGSVIPFTLLVILPTNKRLLDPSLDASSAEASAPPTLSGPSWDSPPSLFCSRGWRARNRRAAPDWKRPIR
jgi:hypothetical protein